MSLRTDRFLANVPRAIRGLSHQELYALVVAVQHRLASESRPSSELARELAAALLPAARAEHLAELCGR